MKFCDEKIQNYLLNGGKIRRRNMYIKVGINKENRLSCDCSDYYILTKFDLTVDDWEIIEPKYNWDKIIKDEVLCEFWDDFEDKENPTVGCLTKKTANGFYKSECDFSWKCCRPFNPADFNIAKDLKEYEK